MDAAIVQDIYATHIAAVITGNNQIKVVPDWKALKGWNKLVVTERNARN